MCIQFWCSAIVKSIVRKFYVGKYLLYNCKLYFKMVTFLIDFQKVKNNYTQIVKKNYKIQFLTKTLV